MEKVDINLEVAHVAFGENYDKYEVSRSCSLAKELLAQFSYEDKSCCVSILVDNKHVNKKVTGNDLWPFLSYVRQFIPWIDYICFESRLHLYKEHVYDLIRSEYRQQVQHDIDRYETKHKIIGCSHDIAIWHLMRLGGITSVDADTLFPAGALGNRPYSLPFPAKKVISILSQSDAAPENRADEEVLRFCQDATVLQRIERIYF